MHKINLYFYYNKITLEKINYLENKTGLNLSSFRKKLNDSNIYLKKQLNINLKSQIILYIFFYFIFKHNII